MEKVSENEIINEIKTGLEKGIILLGDDYFEKEEFIAKLNNSFINEIKIEVFKMDMTYLFPEDGSADEKQIQNIFDTIYRMLTLLEKNVSLVLIIENIILPNLNIEKNKNSNREKELFEKIIELCKVQNVKVILDDIPSKEYNFFNSFKQYTI